MKWKKAPRQGRPPFQSLIRQDEGAVRRRGDSNTGFTREQAMSLVARQLPIAISQHQFAYPARTTLGRSHTGRHGHAVQLSLDQRNHSLRDRAMPQLRHVLKRKANVTRQTDIQLSIGARHRSTVLATPRAVNPCNKWYKSPVDNLNATISTTWPLQSNIATPCALSFFHTKRPITPIRRPVGLRPSPQRATNLQTAHGRRLGAR